jgi:hypothetical protein
MQIEKILEQFSAMIRARLESRVLTTEDSIRYTFCVAASMYAGVRPIDVVFEYPHPVIVGAEIDTVILASAERNSAAIEFKYDRGNPGGTNQNRTQRAASVMGYLFRLAKIPSDLATRRYFVYITDGEMARYFKNPANRLNALCDLAGPTALALQTKTWIDFPTAFRSRVDPHMCDCQVRAVFSAELPQSVTIRAFEVLAA